MLSYISNFRFFISFLFILEFICLFSYSSSIYFFFIFFLIFYSFFSNIVNLNIFNDYNKSIIDVLYQLNSILSIIRYKKKTFLYLFFFYIFFKIDLYYCKSVLKNELSKIYNYIKLDFFFTFYFIL